MTTPCCDANVCWPGFSPSRPRRSPDHPVRCRDSVGGHHHRSSNPRRGSHPHDPGSRRASQWYRCRSAARKRPPGLRFGVGYRCYLKLGARYYNPTTGRFTQPDPVALYGGYVYAGDNPTNFTDPTGRDIWTEFGNWAISGLGGYMVGITCMATVTLATGGAGAVAEPLCALAGSATAGFLSNQMPN